MVNLSRKSAAVFLRERLDKAPQDTSEMSLAEGRLFVLSNLGTIAALDPNDGHMFWLNSYPRDVLDSPIQPMILRAQMMPGEARG